MLEALLRDLPAVGSAPLREMILTALVKLTSRLPQAAPRIRATLQSHQVRERAPTTPYSESRQERGCAGGE